MGRVDGYFVQAILGKGLVRKDLLCHNSSRMSREVIKDRQCWIVGVVSVAQKSNHVDFWALTFEGGTRECIF